ncbi:MAG: DUF4403 family protein [Lewinellaceae bacterium]|nr:DUF4403 family protein [Lewinellaceae bacterium]
MVSCAFSPQFRAFCLPQHQDGATSCEDQYIDIPKDTSFLSTPLVIPFHLIEEKMNEAVEADIVDDDDFDNANKEGKKDNLKLKITRLGKIKVAFNNQVARYQLPLHVLVERQIIDKNALPFTNALSLKTEFSLLITFETTLDIGEDWKLQPQTKFVSFEWLSDVKTLGGLINLKKMVDRRLLKEMPQVQDKMDGKIRSIVHLYRGMSRVWQNIQKPIVINRKERLVWLKIHPIQFEMGTITTEGANLMVQGRISATTETLVSANPDYTIDSILPPLVKRSELPNEAYVYMLSEISYGEISTVIQQKLANKEYKFGNHSIKVKTAEIWGCGKDLVLHMKVRGDTKGDIYFRGEPRYEPDSQKMVIKNFDFEVVTGEALLAGADWLLHSNFKEQIEKELSMPLSELIGKIPDDIMRGIERGRAGKKIDLTIEDWDFKPQKIWVRPDDIAILIIVKAQVLLEMEKLGR